MEPTYADDEITTTCEEATAEFCGSLVRLDCGSEGVYQGIVLEVDPANAHIQIERPYRNGVSLDDQVIQIPGELIKEVLVVRALPNATPTSTNRREQQANKTNSIKKEGANLVKGLQRKTTKLSIMKKEEPICEQQANKTNSIRKEGANLMKGLQRKTTKLSIKEKGEPTREQQANKTNFLKKEGANSVKGQQQKTAKLSIMKKEEPTGEQQVNKTNSIKKEGTNSAKGLQRKTNKLRIKKKEEPTSEQQADNSNSIEKEDANSVKGQQQNTTKLSTNEKEEPTVASKETAILNEEGGEPRFVGCLASVYSANSSDVYQGKILSVDTDEHSIRLEKPCL